jgi:amino acid transporter
MRFKRNWNKRFSGRRGGGTIATAGYILALVGGIIIIILSLAAILHFPLYLPITSPLGGYFGIGIITLILGIVAVVGSRRVNELIWAIVLMVIGFLGGGIGGLLALIGGLLGLLSRYI